MAKILIKKNGQLLKEIPITSERRALLLEKLRMDRLDAAERRLGAFLLLARLLRCR